jgi:hypothetical protein
MAYSRFWLRRLCAAVGGELQDVGSVAALSSLVARTREEQACWFGQ